MIRSAVLAAALCAAAPAARAQTAVDPPRVEVGVDVERLRVLYHFSNPSSFDTATLVPHFFEQRYAIENLWVTADARYTAGIPWRTSGGVTVPHDGRADDFDTFFNPGPSIVVSGTTGDARMQAVRLGQFGEIARAGGARISAGYRLRIDRADFGVGHKTVTRGGALVSAEDVDTRERTTAQLHEFFAAVSVARGAARRWRLAIDGDVAPIAIARLGVELPDKYPGQDFAFVARGFAAHAQLRIIRRAFEAIVDGGRVWSYSSDNAIDQRRVAVGVGLIVR